jgi:hypothetical protein
MSIQQDPGATGDHYDENEALMGGSSNRLPITPHSRWGRVGPGATSHPRMRWPAATLNNDPHKIELTPAPWAGAQVAM